jgi:DNA-binding PadR family transcriptional regulator
MQGASSPLRGALLGLLLERPGHGGDLASRLTRRLGESWQIDPTDVYRLLAGLEQEGLVRSAEDPDAVTARGARVVYHPTDQTATAVTLWLETLLPAEPMRSALSAKLSAARDESDARLLERALKAHERDCLQMAQLLPPATGQAASWKDLFLTCLRSGVAARLQAEIDWSRQTRMRIAEFSGPR